MAQGARVGALGAAKLLAVRLEHSQRRFRPRADDGALVFRERGHEVDRELVGVRHVGGDELDFRLHQRGNEMHVARQAIDITLAGEDMFGRSVLLAQIFKRACTTGRPAVGLGVVDLVASADLSVAARVNLSLTRAVM
jgi:hypothetical protein